ncbi:uncharacterized protein LOC129598217 [Paramacrobiotus metropolitanus]|uniref:uncharacterized protein LOC129598217 n=1 Tax=Paramacrobiotus metropolitanus TaxID=2943436 RepID=UPI002445E2F3|nr:uncharacterized protein LOC129598217 [Paramacrobiotus metropolitanus]
MLRKGALFLAVYVVFSVYLENVHGQSSDTPATGGSNTNTPPTTTPQPDTVESYWLWTAIGIGGGLVLILLIALIYFVCQYQKEHKQVRKLRSEHAPIIEMDVEKAVVNDAFTTEDEGSFVDDIPTRSPTIAVQTSRKQQQQQAQLPNGYPAAPELTNVRVPTDRHSRVLNDDRPRRGPSSMNGDDRRRVRSPSGRLDDRRYPEEEDRRGSANLESRPRRSQYDEEVGRYKSPRRRGEDDFETMSSQMPRYRDRDYRPPKKTRSIPDLDRIDEIERTPSKRIPAGGWSYLPGAVDVYRGIPKASVDPKTEERRDRKTSGQRNDGFILKPNRSVDDLDDRRLKAERSRSPPGDERQWSRDAGNRRSRSSDVGGRRTGDQKRDAYGRPYY